MQELSADLLDLELGEDPASTYLTDRHAHAVDQLRQAFGSQRTLSVLIGEGPSACAYVLDRFLAGLRTVVAFFAGMGRLSALKVFSLALISVILWNGGLLWAGAAIGENWEVIGVYLKKYNRIISVSLVLIITAFIAHRYLIVKRNLESKRES